MPLEAIREIADLLDLSPAEVHDTMSFYGFFRDEQQPLGKTRLWVCRSLACALRGGEELLAHVCQKLNVQPGGTSSGRQDHGRVRRVHRRLRRSAVRADQRRARMNVTTEKVDQLIEELRSK